MIFSSLKRKFKKGFTLVELIVVIAIIAILAAVSVVSYIAFINQANKSADEQAVTQMNTALQAQESTGKPTTITEVYASLKANGMEGKNYKPLSKDKYFFWDSGVNRVVYTNAQMVVSYPTQYASLASTNFFSLSGSIAKEDYSIVSGAATVNTAGEVYKLVSDISSGNVSGTSVSVKIDTPTIDLKGAQLNFGNDKGTLTKDITLEGKSASEPVTIENPVNTVTHYSETAAKSYGGAVFGSVDAGRSVTVKNVVIDNACVGDYSGCVGILFDNIAKGAKITLENVTIKNSKVYGQNKVGILSGQFHAENSADIVFSNVTVENNVVYTNEGEAGIGFGMIYGDSTSVNLHDAISTAKAALNVVRFTNDTIQFTWGANTKVSYNGIDYTTKHDEKVAVDTKTISNVEYVRLCLVPSEKTYMTTGDTSLNPVITGLLFQGKPCIRVYNEQLVNSLS